MANNLNLEVLKSHLFETLEGIKNLNDENASQCEKVEVDQAKAIVDVADAIIDIYKVQVDALRMATSMDNLNSAGDILVGIGIVKQEEIKQIM